VYTDECTFQVADCNAVRCTPTVSNAWDGLRGRGLVIYLVPRMMSHITSCYTRSSTAVHHRISACLPTLPTFQVAEDFALFAATASSSLRFTAPLLATEHFKLLVVRCGTACHRRLRRRRLWQPSALDSRRFSSPNHILTFGWSDIMCVYTHCL